MIIQCRKCETRFRFDEALMEGDGVWVRCSRCQQVFFQERPPGESQPPVPASDPEIPSVRISDARHAPDDRFHLPEDRLPVPVEKKTVPSTSQAAEVKKESPEEIDKEPAIVGIEADMEKEALGGPDAGGEEAEWEDEVPEGESARRRWGVTILKIFAVLLLLLLIAGGAGLWFFPEVQTQVLEWAAPRLQGVPGVEKLLGAGAKGPETARIPVRLKDVRQRSVANLLMGNLRVIEGVAVNGSPSPLAKIRIRLVISDAYDVAIGEKVVFAGNLLTDAELNTLAEAEIQRELSIPQGTDVSNERVAPNGEIPFMIVFSQEQAGAIKTVVMPAGADRIQ